MKKHIQKAKEYKLKLKELNERAKKLYTHDDVINFGSKWRGQRISDVLELDARYLAYMGYEYSIQYSDSLWNDIESQASEQADKGSV